MTPNRQSSQTSPTSTPAEESLTGLLSLLRHPVPLGSGHGDFPPLVKRLWFALQRRRGVFDWLLDKRCNRLNINDRMVLWWALAECYALNGLPAAVAVDTAVSYATRRLGRHSASFINAVLRGILREFPNRSALEQTIAKDAPPHIQAGLPGVLYERWLAEFGRKWTAATGRLLQEDAPVTARMRGCLRGPRQGRPYPQGGIFTEGAAPVDFTRFYLQDPSTILAPMLLAPQPGQDIADLCAAPGGKSLILAEMLNGTGHLTCCDRAEERLNAVRQNLHGYDNVTVQCGDAERPHFAPASFDGILLDVPCSNTGVIRRRPDVRWNFATAGFRELLTHQRTILEATAALVRPGGALVYSTCSIEADENLKQIQAFLSNHPEFTLECSRQLLPTKRHDGAYAARMRRRRQ